MSRKHAPSSISTDRARQLRGAANWPEKIVWSILRNGRLGGLKFRRQHPVGPYTVDFYCHEIGLVIEVDGMSHEDRGDRDRRRTAYLQQQGLRVFRVANHDALSDSEAVRRGIAVVAGVDAG